MMWCEMISKELFTAVTGIKLGTYNVDGVETERRLWIDDTAKTHYVCWDAVPYLDEINIHELAHMVKEWAYDNGYWIDSNLLFVSIGREGSKKVIKTLNGYDLKIKQPYLDFKAGEWILNETTNRTR